MLKRLFGLFTVTIHGSKSAWYGSIPQQYPHIAMRLMVWKARPIPFKKSMKSIIYRKENDKFGGENSRMSMKEHVLQNKYFQHDHTFKLGTTNENRWRKPSEKQKYLFLLVFMKEEMMSERQSKSHEEEI